LRLKRATRRFLYRYHDCYPSVVCRMLSYSPLMRKSRQELRSKPHPRDSIRIPPRYQPPSRHRNSALHPPRPPRQPFSCHLLRPHPQSRARPSLLITSIPLPPSFEVRRPSRLASFPLPLPALLLNRSPFSLTLIYVQTPKVATSSSEA
jgi:hypothetical protein